MVDPNYRHFETELEKLNYTNENRKPQNFPKILKKATGVKVQPARKA
ncbi:hypothetical protein [Candidatus Nanohalobium constans]|nr:hypothetical protein [Candidatus Nanohalobium constans]